MKGLKQSAGGKDMRFTEVDDKGLSGVQKSPRILMVIAEAESLGHHCHLLRGLGFEVLACDSYTEALAMLQSEAFDLVTVGQGSMAFEGKGVVMRALEIDRSTPVLVLARSSDMENYLEAMQLGAVDYLEMPVPPEEFIRVLRTHLLYSMGGQTDS
jgi:two-component system, NtrC family, phosphoglycerate transport system response regulator PgtA